MCGLTCWRHEAKSGHVVLQVTPEQHNLVRVEAHAARVGCKDCCRQKLAQLRGEVGGQGWAGQHISSAWVPRARHKYKLALFLRTVDRSTTFWIILVCLF